MLWKIKLSYKNTINYENNNNNNNRKFKNSKSLQLNLQSTSLFIAVLFLYSVLFNQGWHIARLLSTLHS